MTNERIPSDHIPSPYRAPGFVDDLVSGHRQDPFARLLDDDERQRGFGSWEPARIRKRSRHWRRP